MKRLKDIPLIYGKDSEKDSLSIPCIFKAEDTDTTYLSNGSKFSTVGGGEIPGISEVLEAGNYAESPNTNSWFTVDLSDEGGSFSSGVTKGVSNTYSSITQTQTFISLAVDDVLYNNITVSRYNVNIEGYTKFYDLVNLGTVTVYADDVAAGIGGLVTGDVYQTGAGVLMIKQ